MRHPLARRQCSSELEAQCHRAAGTLGDRPPSQHHPCDRLADRREGSLKLLNADGRTGVTGDNPSDMALSKNSQYLYARIGRTGSIGAFAVQADGSLQLLAGRERAAGEFSWAGRALDAIALYRLPACNLAMKDEGLRAFVLHHMLRDRAIGSYFGTVADPYVDRTKDRAAR